MTQYEIFATIVALAGIVLGLFNYFDRRRLTKQTELTSTGDYLLDTNQAIVIANQRAKEAEKERREAEVVHKEEMAALKQEIEKLQKRLEKVEQALAYEIHLVAHLGDEPRVEAISIKRIPASNGE